MADLPIEADNNAAMAQPAVYVNRFVVAKGAEGVRIAVLETNGALTWCRFALAMTTENALRLADLINLIVKETPSDPGRQDQRPN